MRNSIPTPTRLLTTTLFTALALLACEAPGDAVDEAALREQANETMVEHLECMQSPLNDCTEEHAAVKDAFAELEPGALDEGFRAKVTVNCLGNTQIDCSGYSCVSRAYWNCACWDESGEVEDGDYCEEIRHHDPRFPF